MASCQVVRQEWHCRARPAVAPPAGSSRRPPISGRGWSRRAQFRRPPFRANGDVSAWAISIGPVASWLIFLCEEGFAKYSYHRFRRYSSTILTQRAAQRGKSATFAAKARPAAFAAVTEAETRLV